MKASTTSPRATQWSNGNGHRWRAVGDKPCVCISAVRPMRRELPAARGRTAIRRHHDRGAASSPASTPANPSRSSTGPRLSYEPGSWWCGARRVVADRGPPRTRVKAVSGRAVAARAAQWGGSAIGCRRVSTPATPVAHHRHDRRRHHGLGSAQPTARCRSGRARPWRRRRAACGAPRGRPSVTSLTATVVMIAVQPD